MKTGRTAAIQAQTLTRGSFADYVAMVERLAATRTRASATRFRSWPARPARNI